LGLILMGLTVVSVLAATAGLCWSDCDPRRALLPFTLVAVPLVYLGASLAWLRGRERRAQADPSWAARVARSGVVANVATAAILAVLALVGSCFGLLFAGGR
ncbi:MAG: hypothetical protein ABR562_06865, partial [Thermoplasmatota archaeon]